MANESDEAMAFNDTIASDVPVYLKQSLPMIVVYTVAYSSVFFLGVVGNSLIVWIVLCNPRMRNVTNYFIVNLAVADILVCVFCLPITLLTNLLSGWNYGAFMCKATPFLQGTAVSASVNTLMAIAFDRYLAICHGLRCHVSGRTARIIIVLIWSFAAAIMSPWAVFYRQRPHDDFQQPTSTGNASSDDDTTAQPTTTTMTTTSGSGVGAEYVEYICVQNWPTPRMERNYFLVAIFVTCYTIPLEVEVKVKVRVKVARSRWW